MQLCCRSSFCRHLLHPLLHARVRLHHHKQMSLVEMIQRYSCPHLHLPENASCQKYRLAAHWHSPMLNPLIWSSKEDQSKDASTTGLRIELPGYWKLDINHIQCDNCRNVVIREMLTFCPTRRLAAQWQSINCHLPFTSTVFQECWDGLSTNFIPGL